MADNSCIVNRSEICKSGESLMSSPIKPVIRWAGSKRQLLSILSNYWDSRKHRRYLEPFAGSASLFFFLQPPAAILGDINAELISMYQQMKHQLPELLTALSQFGEGSEEYYRTRSLDATKLDSPTCAARFIHLNRYCFNGLYRTNRKGEFNVPYGGGKSGSIPSTKEFEECSRLLGKARLVSGDFSRVLRSARPGDFVYIDPPYSIRSRRVFNEYNASIFDSKDLKRLNKWMHRLTERGIEFLVSYAYSKEASSLQKDFDCKRVRVRRNIAGFGNKRRYAIEVLISNRQQL